MKEIVYDDKLVERIRRLRLESEYPLSRIVSSVRRSDPTFDETKAIRIIEKFEIGNPIF